MNIRFTLVGDGPTDAALLPIISWAIRSDRRVREIEAQFAHPSTLPPTRDGLAARLRAATKNYSGNIFFVHRDAERESISKRRKEIQDAIATLKVNMIAVPVVPVRMTEAWLLIDEFAIRSAAGNPNGNCQLNLPKIGKVETESQPKQVLYSALKAACELKGRRLTKFDPCAKAWLVSERISDFKPLRQFQAFVEFEKDLGAALDKLDRS